MKRLVSFRVHGYEPTPWSVPNIGRNGGAYRTKKSRPNAGILNLDDWQKAVAVAAKAAMGAASPTMEQVAVAFTFFTRAPVGVADGTLWRAEVKWSEKAAKGKGGWVKARAKGRGTEPDRGNLVKGTEDALEGIVFRNDVQVRVESSSMIYHRIPGVLVVVDEIDTGDFLAW